MLSAPGKIFLLGEYAVLTGAPAWITAVPPRFELRDPEHVGEEVSFHPESPAGRFLTATRSTRLSGRFIDPWEGRGGFGGSTAEFAFAAYRGGLRTPLEAWRAYRKLSELEPSVKRPSGADLVAQWTGGTIEWNPRTEVVKDLAEDLRNLPILLFSATHLPNRKTVTHTHLETLSSSSLSFESLLPALERAQKGARAGDWVEVGHAFSAFADSLAHLGLESPAVRNERLALSRQSGVLGVKGCGSLQTDAMAVIVESLTDPRTDKLIEFASQECSLRLVSRGLADEPGIQETGS